SVGGIWLLFLGWFLAQASLAEAELADGSQALGMGRVGDAMSRQPTVVDPSATVEQLLDDGHPDHRFSTYPVVDDGRLAGVASRRTAAAVPTLERDQRRVVDVMEPLGAAATVHPR